MVSHILHLFKKKSIFRCYKNPVVCYLSPEGAISSGGWLFWPVKDILILAQGLNYFKGRKASRKGAGG